MASCNSLVALIAKLAKMEGVKLVGKGCLVKGMLLVKFHYAGIRLSSQSTYQSNAANLSVQLPAFLLYLSLSFLLHNMYCSVLGKCPWVLQRNLRFWTAWVLTWYSGLLKCGAWTLTGVQGWI